MADVTSTRSLPSDRAAVERTTQELVLDVARRRTPTGISIVIEGAPGIGKTFLARRILDSVPPGEAKVLIVAGEPGGSIPATRERIEHDLTEDEKHCASCHQYLRRMGEESSERYE